MPKGILTPNFIEIALAVTKRALLTDDDDGRHVIAIKIMNTVNGSTCLTSHNGSSESELIPFLSCL
jgi:hypothetical protein